MNDLMNKCIFMVVLNRIVYALLLDDSSGPLLA